MKGKVLLLLKSYWQLVLEALFLIHTGTAIVKCKASLKAAFLLSPFGMAFHDIHFWWKDNSDYVTFVACAILIDYVLGTIKHTFIDRDFCFVRNLLGLCRKIGLVVLVGILFEGMTTIVTRASIIKDYLEIVARLMVFLYPAGSAFGNSSVLSGGVFPPEGWMKKINHFTENANPKVFAEEIKQQKPKYDVNQKNNPVRKSP